MFGNDQISPGDMFAASNNSLQKVYVVEALVQRPGIPAHVRLAPKGQRGSTGMLMSTSALLDPRFWRRVPAPTS